MNRRIIALSDSHGASNRLRCAILQALKDGPVNTVVFLGDGSKDFEELLPFLVQKGIHTYAVCGNNDWTSSDPQEIVFSENGVTFYCCHGHTRYVRLNLDNISYAAQEKGAKVVLHGHTHIPKVSLLHDLTIICPGAVCETGKYSIAYADISVPENGFISARLVHLEDNEHG